MNQIVKCFIILLVGSILFTSCEKSENVAENSSVDTELKSQDFHTTAKEKQWGTLSYDNFSYDIYEEYCSYYVDGIYQYDFSIVGLNTKIIEINETSFKAVNLNKPGEYIIFDDLNETENGGVFDVTFSTGETIDNVTVTVAEKSGTDEARPGGIPWGTIFEIVVPFIVGGNGDDGMGIPEACAAAAAAMAANCGGIMTFEIDDGWFSTDCTVSCSDGNG